jgi:hypothetical protein
VWRGSWLELAAVEDQRPLLDRLCLQAGLRSVEHVPPATRAVVAYRVISAFLGHGAFGRVHWECRNGYCDSSGGGGGGRRDEFFEHFPAARARLEVSEPDDVLGVSAYRFWFLLKEGKPRLAIEASRGIAWDANGRATDLFAAYAAHRKVWPALWAAASQLLP